MIQGRRREIGEQQRREMERMLPAADVDPFNTMRRRVREWRDEDLERIALWGDIRTPFQGMLAQITQLENAPEPEFHWFGHVKQGLYICVECDHTMSVFYSEDSTEIRVTCPQCDYTHTVDLTRTKPMEEPKVKRKPIPTYMMKEFERLPKDVIKQYNDSIVSVVCEISNSMLSSNVPKEAITEQLAKELARAILKSGKMEGVEIEPTEYGERRHMEVYVTTNKEFIDAMLKAFYTGFDYAKEQGKK